MTKNSWELYGKQIYYDRKNQGLCPKCGSPVSPNGRFVLCKKCRNKRNKQHEAYKAKKAAEKAVEQPTITVTKKPTLKTRFYELKVKMIFKLIKKVERVLDKAMIKWKEELKK